jgi:phage gpG-like protein
MPAGLDVSVQVFGEDVVRRRFLRFADQAEDASAAFSAIVGILERATAANFATRGVSGGSRWRDLKPATRARKRREHLDPRILQATHRLHDSLVDSSHPEHVEHITADSLRWGSTVPYGVYHQSTRPRRVIPYRPPVRLSEVDKRQVVRELQASITGALNSARGLAPLLRDPAGRFRAAHRP